MALTIKVLANGRVPDTLGDPVYSPSSATPAKVAIVKIWRFTNTSGGAVVLNAYFQKGGDDFDPLKARHILARDVLIPPGHSVIDDLDLTLGPGDGIYADASAGDVVDVVVSGMERDA